MVLSVVSEPWPSLRIRRCQWDEALVPTPMVPTPSKQIQECSCLRGNRTQTASMLGPCGQDCWWSGSQMYWSILVLSDRNPKQTGCCKIRAIYQKMLVFIEHTHGNGRPSQIAGPWGTFSPVRFS